MDNSTLDNNFVIDNGNVIGDESRVFFSGDGVELLPKSTDFLDILVRCGTFTSKSQARKNNFNPIIPDGWNDITVGKKKTRICILNPLPWKYNPDEDDPEQGKCIENILKIIYDMKRYFVIDVMLEVDLNLREKNENK